MTDNAFADLFSGGSATARFERPGVTVEGSITQVKVTQARVFKNGEMTDELDKWDSGEPKMQAAITVQTDQHDAGVEGDDGRRTIYIKGWGEQKRAMVECLRNANAKGTEPGGWFSATYTGDGVPANKAMTAPKLFKYVYRAPSAQATATLFGGDGGSAPAPQAPAAPSTAAPSYTPPAPPANVPPAYQAPAAPAYTPPAPPAPPADAQALIQEVKAYQAANWPAQALFDSGTFAGRINSVETIQAIYNQ